MKPHKHAELIKAWADGAEIEALFFNDARDYWTVVPNPAWSNVNLRFRIKPEPKPDVLEEAYVMKRLNGEVCICQGFHEIPNVRFIWDGETDKLKSIEIIK